MFKINLSSFSKQTEVSFKIKENDVFFDEDILINKELSINLTLTKDTDNRVIIQGKITGELKNTCVRCLEKFIWPITANFTSIFERNENFSKNDKEDNVYFYEKNEIDLFDYLRETLLLELPVKPLCNDNCKGLCPVCGKNLNKEKCDCKKDFKNRPFNEFNILNKKEE